jgi:hypothetical protein
LATQATILAFWTSLAAATIEPDRAVCHARGSDARRRAANDAHKHHGRQIHSENRPRAANM